METVRTLRNTAAIGDVFSWAEISGIHRVRNGVYQRREKLISLLTDFGRINPCYPDHEGKNSATIHYTGAGRRGDQKLDAPNRALRAAITSGHSVPLFNKLAVNRWEFLGFWRVTEGVYLYEENAGRMIWRFTLEADSETRN